MTFVRIGGVAHHVTVEGSGPVCVLSAGLGLSWFDWDPVVPLLAPYRTVVRFDRPGHGLSAPAAAPPTAAGEADRIAALLDALDGGHQGGHQGYQGDDRGDQGHQGDRGDQGHHGHRGHPAPVTVVGHSLAGFHAEAFARLHPTRTAGLVLVDSSVEEHPRPARTDAVSRALGGALCAAGLPAALGPAVRRAAVRSDPASRALVRRVYRTSRVLRGALLENAHYGAVAAGLLDLRDRFPLPPGLPVTVLAAPDGSARWERRQRALARRLGATYEAVVPSGHLVMLDRPDAVARAVLSTTRS
ncbi:MULTISPECIES: alpha/beta fold hydrolase [Streptomyces]|uniref:Alpha/beta hydrolase n=1 Tax=Streptomyces venezuelae TaxID=54571 RepID=A0A5P2B2L2_STRVZ|nr:alpha/beta hydrolase [Streptomyces venezuelae]QES22579.1 alpha/beta hydrolase [Streptomyces venezuelae]